MTDPRDTMRWVWRGTALAALLIGWVFIAWQNAFRFSAPLLFVCLGYLAVVATIANLWRTGAAAVDSGEDGADSTWAKPAGALGELEREKRTLLKAIKEAEFDHQMGKLSERDAEEMIRGYRARAIEVIKEIDRLGLGAAGTVREQILREVRARIQLEAKAPKAGAQAKAGARADASGKRTDRARQADPQPAASAVAGKDAADKDATGKDAAGKGVVAEDAAGKGVVAEDAAGKEAVAAGTTGKDAQPQDALADAAPAGAADEAASAAAGDPNRDAVEPGAARPSRAAVQVPRDDELDADSTTALEPRADDPAKEATP